MRYEMLGSLKVKREDLVTTVSAPKTELLLATLLVRAGQVVSSDQLGREIWGDEPPRRTMAAMHVHISQLRKLLGGSGRGTSPVETRSPGYLLRLGADDELDVAEFRRLVESGREVGELGHYEESSRLLGKALDLWRGTVPEHWQGGPILGEFVTWAEEARLECLELKLNADLCLGRDRELIAMLRSLVTEHPLREAFHRQLMLALYRADRQGDALKVYQYARETLDRELGVGPGRALREIYQAILTCDGTLELRAAA
ncbi:BTAD domain-containing putative transcriptional regulator [Streptomyces sp. NPDC007983]|uniref:AfsR/SARP family transcriptional regulator n=1 Tax=Streptomyces sp. NPDC007983 TaxID=3364800 RepID=UPI0036E5EB11